MDIVIILVLLFVILVIWVVFTQRKLEQEQIITEGLKFVVQMAEVYPEMKETKIFVKRWGAICFQQNGLLKYWGFVRETILRCK